MFVENNFSCGLYSLLICHHPEQELSKTEATRQGTILGLKGQGAAGQALPGGEGLSSNGNEGLGDFLLFSVIK